MSFYVWVYTGKIIWVLERNKTYSAKKHGLLRNKMN